MTAVDRCYKMPPRRRSSKASQKESDERLSIAETIAGLASSIEQPPFSPHRVITRQNSYDDKSAPDFARLPSMVVEEVDGPAASSTSLNCLPLPARSASVDGTGDAADRGQTRIPSRKLRSPANRLQVRAQSQQSVCIASDVVNKSQSTSAMSSPDTSESTTCTKTDHLRADTTSCSVSVPFSSDPVFSAVLVGWNPPVVASSTGIESVLPCEVSSPLLALTTVDPAHNNSVVQVLKLPLVLEPISDSTWQLVPMSASAAFDASVLPTAECVIQSGAQHSGQSTHVGHLLNGNVSHAGVGNSASVINDLVTGNDSIVRSVSYSDHVTRKSLTSSSHSISGPSTSEEAVSQSSILGSLGALRDYYKRISTDNVQSSSSTATAAQILSSAASLVSPGLNEVRCIDALDSMIPVLSVSDCSAQTALPSSCTLHLSAAKNLDSQTKVNVNHMSASSLMNGSRILPEVSVDRHRASCDSSNLLTESRSHLDRSKSAPLGLTDGGCEQSSPKRLHKLLRHLPPKKRQKVSSGIRSAVVQNGCQHKTADESGDKQTVDDSEKDVNVDPPDILLSEEIVTHTEHPLPTDVTISGKPKVSAL